MQHNLTCTAPALIPFPLAADPNPSTICCKLSLSEGSPNGGGKGTRPRTNTQGFLHTFNLGAHCFKVCPLKIRLISASVPPFIKYLTAACMWMNASSGTGTLPMWTARSLSCISLACTPTRMSESPCLAQSRMMRNGRGEFWPAGNWLPGLESFTLAQVVNASTHLRL